MSQPVIEVDHLWFAYNAQPVLEDVTFSVEEGDFVAVIGPNGGGKTTLIKLMLGLLKPSGGNIRVLGQPPLKSAPQTGYVPQGSGVNQNLPISVHHVVLMGCMHGLTLRGFSSRDRARTREALEQVGMWEMRSTRVTDLSGGQLQRVLVARALASNPSILFLDEPTSNVDKQGQTEFYELLKDLNEKVTIVIVCHDLMVLSSYVKSVACVNKRVYFHHSPEITPDMLKNAYHCPVELVAHGVPHRVLPVHEDEPDA
jgi:zinc transport system ATP-binding protein